MTGPRGDVAEAVTEPPPRPQMGRGIAGTVSAGLVAQLALVVTGPLLARMLGPEGRGYFAALTLWPVLIGFVGSLGAPTAITYFVAGRPGAARAIARQALRLGAIQTLILAPVHLAVVLALFAGDPGDVPAAALVSLLGVPGLLAYQYGLAILQGELRLLWLNVLRVLPVLLYALVVVTLFAAGSESLVAATSGWILAYLAVGLATLAFALRTVRGAASPDRPPATREVLGFGLRGFLGSNSMVDLVRPDQLVLVLFLSPVSLGIYVVGLAFTNLPYFVSKAISLVALPSVAKTASAAPGRRLMWSYFWLTSAAAVLIAAALALAAGWLVPLFFGDAFREAVSITRIVLAGAVLLAARRILGEGLRGRGHPGLGTIAELAALAWLLPALAVLAPTAGVTGVAIALSSSYAVGFGALLVAGLRVGELRAADARLGLLDVPRLLPDRIQSWRRRPA